jgi:hypothetical protein
MVPHCCGPLATPKANSPSVGLTLRSFLQTEECSHAFGAYTYDLPKPIGLTGDHRGRRLASILSIVMSYVAANTCKIHAIRVLSDKPGDGEVLRAVAHLAMILAPKLAEPSGWRARGFRTKSASGAPNTPSEQKCA